MQENKLNNDFRKELHSFMINQHKINTQLLAHNDEIVKTINTFADPTSYYDSFGVVCAIAHNNLVVLADFLEKYDIKYDSRLIHHIFNQSYSSIVIQTADLLNIIDSVSDGDIKLFNDMCTITDLVKDNSHINLHDNKIIIKFDFDTDVTTWRYEYNKIFKGEFVLSELQTLNNILYKIHRLLILLKDYGVLDVYEYQEEIKKDSYCIQYDRVDDNTIKVKLGNIHDIIFSRDEFITIDLGEYASRCYNKLFSMIAEHTSNYEYHTV